MDLIKRHWFTLTSGEKCSELQLKKWVKALAQMSHNLLKFVINSSDGNVSCSLYIGAYCLKSCCTFTVIFLLCLNEVSCISDSMHFNTDSVKSHT